MAQVASDPRVALYERYQSVPSHQRAEIIRGTLYVMPRPAPLHANASSVLGGELSGPFQRGRGGPGGWWILDEPELHLVSLEPTVPDLAGWRVERMPRWLLDPVAKTLEVHALGENGRWREVRIHQGDVRVRAAPFEAIEIDLSALWSPPSPSGT